MMMVTPHPYVALRFRSGMVLHLDTELQFYAYCATIVSHIDELKAKGLLEPTAAAALAELHARNMEAVRE